MNLFQGELYAFKSTQDGKELKEQILFQELHLKFMHLFQYLWQLMLFSLHGRNKLY